MSCVLVLASCDSGGGGVTNPGPGPQQPQTVTARVLGESPEVGQVVAIRTPVSVSATSLLAVGASPADTLRFVRQDDSTLVAIARVEGSHAYTVELTATTRLSIPITVRPSTVTAPAAVVSGIAAKVDAMPRERPEGAALTWSVDRERLLARVEDFNKKFAALTPQDQLTVAQLLNPLFAQTSAASRTARTPFDYADCRDAIESLSRAMDRANNIAGATALLAAAGVLTGGVAATLAAGSAAIMGFQVLVVIREAGKALLRCEAVRNLEMLIPSLSINSASSAMNVAPVQLRTGQTMKIALRASVSRFNASDVGKISEADTLAGLLNALYSLLDAVRNYISGLLSIPPRLQEITSTPTEQRDVDASDAEWSTSNAAIARVSEDGIVTAVAPGSARITAEVDDVSVTQEVEVRGGIAPGYWEVTATFSGQWPDYTFQCQPHTFTYYFAAGVDTLAMIPTGNIVVQCPTNNPATPTHTVEAFTFSAGYYPPYGRPATLQGSEFSGRFSGGANPDVVPTWEVSGQFSSDSTASGTSRFTSIDFENGMETGRRVINGTWTARRK